MPFDLHVEHLVKRQIVYGQRHLFSLLPSHLLKKYAVKSKAGSTPCPLAKAATRQAQVVIITPRRRKWRNRYQNRS